MQGGVQEGAVCDAGGGVGQDAEGQPAGEGIGGASERAEGEESAKGSSSDSDSSGGDDDECAEGGGVVAAKGGGGGAASAKRPRACHHFAKGTCRFGQKSADAPHTPSRPASHRAGSLFPRTHRQVSLLARPRRRRGATGGARAQAAARQRAGGRRRDRPAPPADAAAEAIREGDPRRAFAATAELSRFGRHDAISRRRAEPRCCAGRRERSVLLKRALRFLLSPKRFFKDKSY